MDRKARLMKAISKELNNCLTNIEGNYGPTKSWIELAAIYDLYHHGRERSYTRSKTKVKERMRLRRLRRSK